MESEYLCRYNSLLLSVLHGAVVQDRELSYAATPAGKNRVPDLQKNASGTWSPIRRGISM